MPPRIYRAGGDVADKEVGDARLVDGSGEPNEDSGEVEVRPLGVGAVEVRAVKEEVEGQRTVEGEGRDGDEHECVACSDAKRVVDGGAPQTRRLRVQHLCEAEDPRLIEGDVS